MAEGLDDAIRRRDFEQSRYRQQADDKVAALKVLGGRFQELLDDFVKRMSTAPDPHFDQLTELRKHRKMYGWRISFVVPQRERVATVFVQPDGRAASYDSVAREIRYADAGPSLAQSCFGSEEPMFFSLGMGWDGTFRRAVETLGDELVSLLARNAATWR